MNILICGNYGATNIGDELILKGLLQSISRNSNTVTVFSNNPLETSKTHHVKSIYFLPTGLRSFFRSLYTFSLFKTLYVYIRTDEFILGGGGLMQDQKPRAILIWGLHLLVAIIFRKKIKILDNSVGPLNKKWSRMIVKFLFNKANEITVRDKLSLKLLKEIGVKQKVDLVEDFALSIEEKGNLAYRQTGKIKEKEKNDYIILSLRSWYVGKNKQKFESELIKLINYLTQEKRYKIIGIPFEELKDDDERYLTYIKDKVLNKKMFHVQKYSSDLNRIFELYQNAKMIIGMRLHSIILAKKFKKPFIAISYSEKVRGFCENYNDTESICVDLNDFDANNITTFNPLF